MAVAMTAEAPRERFESDPAVHQSDSNPPLLQQLPDRVLRHVHRRHLVSPTGEPRPFNADLGGGNVFPRKALVDVGGPSPPLIPSMCKRRVFEWTRTPASAPRTASTVTHSFSAARPPSSLFPTAIATAPDLVLFISVTLTPRESWSMPSLSLLVTSA